MPRASVAKDVPPVEEEETVEEVEPETASDGAGDDGGDEETWDSRSMDPNEELWEGGPKFAQINAWKDDYGDIFVTSVTPDKHVVWRTLTRFEYRRLVKNLEQAVSTGQVTQGEANMNNEEQIAELCILYPEFNRTQNANEMAGVVTTIAQQVMEASGFGSVEVRQL